MTRARRRIGGRSTPAGSDSCSRDQVPVQNSVSATQNLAVPGLRMPAAPGSPRFRVLAVRGPARHIITTSLRRYRSQDSKDEGEDEHAEVRGGLALFDRAERLGHRSPTPFLEALQSIDVHLLLLLATQIAGQSMDAQSQSSGSRDDKHSLELVRMSSRDCISVKGGEDKAITEECTRSTYIGGAAGSMSRQVHPRPVLMMSGKALPGRTCRCSAPPLCMAALTLWVLLTGTCRKTLHSNKRCARGLPFPVLTRDQVKKPATSCRWWSW